MTNENECIILDDTITVAIDTMDGLCDRVMLGAKGIIANANATLECWNYNQDEDFYELLDENDTSRENVEQAIMYLETDNFGFLILDNQTIVTNELIIGRNIKQLEELKNLTVVDVETIEFDENGTYKIF